MIMSSKIAGGDERMHLRRCSFWWPCKSIEAIHAASLDAACPRLHRKPLDAAIGQLLAPYRSGGRQSNNQLNSDGTCTHFVGHFYGLRDAMVLYRAHCPMEEVRGFHKSHECHHRVSTRSDIIKGTSQCRKFTIF